MTRSELWRLDAGTLAARVEAGEVSPVDLVETSLERCDRLEPVLNAFVFVDRQGARAAARDAAARARAGTRLGPLDGIPVSIKDNLYVRNMPASWGSLMLQDHIADRDDIFVERLRRAGVVIIGKTTTPEFALMGKTESRLKGVTRNPWDPALTPGGSSGGAVASVAAGVVPIAFGTDAGGSIRTPAGYTGLVGLRPSNGRVPRRFGFPPMALDFQAIGLATRTMADLDLALAAVAGPDPRDPASHGVPALDMPDVRSLRIGWFDHIGDERSDPEVAASLAAACDALTDAGCRVSEVEAPFDIGALRRIWDVLTAVGAARAALALPAWETSATPQIAALTRKGRDIPAIDYVRALDDLREFRADVSAASAGFDAFLTPSAAAPAFPCGLDCPAVIGGRPGTGATQGMFTAWVNALGFAGLNVPGTPHPDSRPIGLQIVAPFGRDGTALAIGRSLETTIAWQERWPALASQAA